MQQRLIVYGKYKRGRINFRLSHVGDIEFLLLPYRRLDERPLRVPRRLCRADPRGRPYFWMTGGGAPTGELGPEIDQAAIADGYVTLTPLEFDLTSTARLGALAAWPLRLPSAE